MAKSIKNHKSSFFLQAGFFAFCAMLIFIIVPKTTNKQISFDTRSRAYTETKPQILSFRAEGTTDKETYIKWTTNVPATTYVAYDTVNTSFGGSAETWGKWRVNTDNTSPQAMVTTHVVRIGGLAPNTTYYFRAASRNYPQIGILALAANVINTTTQASLVFERQPSISFDSDYSSTTYNFHLNGWQTSLPSVFIEGLSTSQANLGDSDPTKWVNIPYNLPKSWSSTYQRVNNSRYAYFTVNFGTQYYYRVAAKDQNGKITLSSIVPVKRVFTPTPAPKANCCGYNKALSSWYCYTNCTGYNPDVTTIYPSKVCQTVAQCTQ